MKHWPRISTRWSMLAPGLLLVANTIATAAGAQSAAGEVHHSRIVGVYDQTTGDPIAGVRLVDAVTGISVITMSTGRVNVRDLPDGRTTVGLQKIGYKPISLLLTIGPSDTVPLRVTMTRLTDLPAVAANAAHTSSGLRGFDERQAGGHGYFISDSTLRQNENTSLSNVLAANIPSTSVKSTGLRTQVVSNRMMINGKACAVDVYLDGVLVSSNANPVDDGSTALGDPTVTKQIRGATALPKPSQAADQVASDINQFLVRDLAAIEFHDVANMPIELAHTSSGCGAIFLWSKR